MAFIRNLEEAEMTLLKSEGQERTASGSAKEIWTEVKKIKVQISTTTVKKIVDNIKYTEINYLGVVRGLSNLQRGNYRLSDNLGLYEVLDHKKIGPRTIIRFKLIEGEKIGGPKRI